jgi:hypothetical protein
MARLAGLELSDWERNVLTREYTGPLEYTKLSRLVRKLAHAGKSRR